MCGQTCFVDYTLEEMREEERKRRNIGTDGRKSRRCGQIGEGGVLMGRNAENSGVMSGRGVETILRDIN